jgi:hypothetical protein
MTEYEERIASVLRRRFDTADSQRQEAYVRSLAMELAVELAPLNDAFDLEQFVNACSHRVYA